MNEGFIYKLIFRKALGDANEVYHKEAGYFSSKKLLKTMWDRMGIESPIPPFADYFNTGDEKEDKIWRRYEINEKKFRSIFLNMEKIKLTNSIILKQVNIMKLMQDK